MSFAPTRPRVSVSLTPSAIGFGRRTYLGKQLAQAHQSGRHHGVPEVRGREQHPSNFQVNELGRKWNHQDYRAGDAV